MKKLVMLLACSMYGCVSGMAYGGDPNSTLPPLSSLKLARPLSCNCDKGEPCTCDPASCKCPGCMAVGCKRGSASTTTADEANYAVGADPFGGFTQVVRPVTKGIVYPIDPVDPNAPKAAVQTYHTEYRKVCNGTSCQMVAVNVPDAPQASSTTYSSPAYGASPFASASCASCGAQGAQASCGVNGSPRTPVRGLLRRLFRGRSGCGG